ncbi:phosphatidate cytidylyltransferase [Aporhodopirellula aestuarii]|uniref:Phosphatidate cytidylyltransferase n=1 Tax=Aporhodopirellula aestuarii TaxID=2950107 RepID=A0ABT0U078_9BACT|nr:phosphatidate cytidylyltransferase [Aporhodopirellula aestuarii]MCM2370308.1 phosphatidate cytidylyltransferase [Aporhodopirellula aestuarii]
MSPTSPTAGVAYSVIGLLIAGTIVRLSTLQDRTSPVSRKRIASLLSWWIVAAWVLLAAMGGRVIASVLFAIVSSLAFREYASLASLKENGLRRGSDETQGYTGGSTGAACGFGLLQTVGYLAITASYAGLAIGLGGLWLASIPLAVVLFSCVLFAEKTELANFTHRASQVVYGVLLTCSLPACSLLLSDPVDATFTGLFLMVIGLTEWNDILAAWVGRVIGKTKLAPVISPNKTVEGFVGGVVGTVATAAFLGPWLTSFNMTTSVSIGFAIALAGTLGDLNMSAIKRAAGVKDSGALLPGQGGILDRIDSLTFSAPVTLLILELTR